MYHREVIQNLVSFIDQRNGIADKQVLSKQVQSAFNLTKDRSVFFCRDFAIRFCSAHRRSFSNTVLSLSALQKYDNIPFVVCLVTPQQNYLMLANTTFLRKISHSSQELRVDNIKGSFNGSDIVRQFEEFDNAPDNFEFLFTSHENYPFSENLERLVEATNNIQPKGTRFLPTAQQVSCIVDSVARAKGFMESGAYSTLNDDLQSRVQEVASEIAIAAFIENLNLRGRIIEYLITTPGDLRQTLIEALHTSSPLPEIFTADKLGDYERELEDFCTATDIKTKVLFLTSNPKGYNIDKLLSFLASEKSVYLIFVVAIDAQKNISTRLCSLYNRQLLSGTRIMKHWAGRNSRGVTQYDGTALERVVFDFDRSIDTVEAEAFIRKCIDI